MKSFRRWTEQQVNILIEKYPTGGALEVSRIIGKSIKSIRDKANSLNISVLKEFVKTTANTEDLNHFISNFTPHTAYILGLLWADGYISKNSYSVKFSMVVDDFQDIKKLVKNSAKSWRIHCRVNGNGGFFGKYKCKKIVSCRMSSKTFRNFLVENDYTIKSGASADKIISILPRHLRHYWWRGYFDGDGMFSISHHERLGTRPRMSNAVGISSCAHQDWTFAKNLCIELNISHASLRINKTEKGSSSQFSIRVIDEIKRFCEYIYTGEQFGIKRKLAKYKQFLHLKNEIAKRRAKKKTSKYLGVGLSCKIPRPKKCWIMSIHNKAPIKKNFETEIEAAREYDRLAIEFRGKNAVLNFPNEQIQ